MSDTKQSSLNDQIDFYNLFWSKLESFSSYKIYRIQRILQYLVQIRKKLDNLSILDLGCGDGRSVAVWSIVGRASGMDLSSKAMETASKLFPNLEFSAGDATRTDYETGSYNVVISQEVIEHIADQRLYIAECSRLLASGGYLILTTPNRYYFDRVEGGNYSKQPIENILSASELKFLVKDFFRIEKIESIIIARGEFGLYRILSNRFFVGVLHRLGLDFIRIRLMEKYFLGLNICMIARKV